MKRIAVLAVVVLPLAGYLVAKAQHPRPPAPAEEKKVTITESHLNRLVEQRIAKRMLEEQKSLDQTILDSKHWHTAIYEGVIYHVYTGPGNAMAVTWAQQPGSEEQPQTPPEGTSQTVPPQTTPAKSSATTPAARPPATPTRRP